MTTIEKATQFMEDLAADNSHGYDQANRWGPDYDCSSAVISAWQNAGVPVKSYGASYTGNMYPVFKQCGFEDVTSQVNLATGAGLQRGDVLLNHRNHTAMYCDHGTIAQASINENGGTTGGQPGDQTGREICLRSYYNYPWDAVLRYAKGAAEKPSDNSDEPAKPEAPEKPKQQTCSFVATFPVLQYGDKDASKGGNIEGDYVSLMQRRLILKGYSCGWWGADGDFGSQTKIALHKFQKDRELEQDAVAGPKTWQPLISL